MKVLINAGHGGKDCGAIGKNGTKEADINSNIARLVCKYLKDKNIETVYFQQKNSLNEVIKLCNIGNFDFGVSIHCNAAVNRQANGIETLYYPTSTQGKQLAKCIQEELIKTVKLKDRGIKTRKDLGFLKRTKPVTVLVECAFISNEKEEQLLKEKYNIFAQAITRGIMTYVKGSNLPVEANL